MADALLYEPTRFDFLIDEPWDPARVEDAIAAIVFDADAAFDRDALWPAHEWDGFEEPLPLTSLYAGAAGVIWALDALRRTGHAESSLELAPAALRTLEHAPLNSKSRASWVVRLRYAYADTLLEAGRPEDALEWFHRTEAVDTAEATDAHVAGDERVEETERRGAGVDVADDRSEDVSNGVNAGVDDVYEAHGIVLVRPHGHDDDTDTALVS